MNKTLLASKILLVTCLLLCVFPSIAKEKTNALIPLNTEEDIMIADRLNNLESIVDVRYSTEVKMRIKNYIKTYPRGSEIILGRVSMYFPIIENKLREKNLPDDLKYLAIVESALKADAISKSGAAGLWQFMKGTGKMYGLKVSSKIDERRDPYKATDAALDYLSDLHDQFGNWTLALAAYNCGPGNVRKAIRRSGGKKDFWEIRKFLPAETRKYIPRHIAATYLMQYYYTHNLEPEVLDDKLVNTTTTKVFQSTNFSQIQVKSGVSLENLRFLNPSYLKDFIPSSENYNLLTLPELEMNTYLGKTGEYENIVYAVQNSVFKNKNALVRKQRTRRVLQAMETMNRDIILFENQKASIPPMRRSLQSLPASSAIRSDLYEYHQLKKRESLYDLVRRFENVSLSSILELNNFTLESPPAVGSMIKIRRK